MAESPSFASRLFSFLSIVEKIALVVAFIGIAFRYLNLTGAPMLIMLGLSTLAGVYFLLAYRPPPTDGETTGFTALLVTTILPKITGIASAVLVIGILFQLLNLTGAREMLMVGAMAGALVAVLLGLFIAQGNEQAKSQVGFLYRLVPLLMLTCYYLMPSTS